jgi:hypothetical protein
MGSSRLGQCAGSVRNGVRHGRVLDVTGMRVTGIFVQPEDGVVVGYDHVADDHGRFMIGWLRLQLIGEDVVGIAERHDMQWHIRKAEISMGFVNVRKVL